VSIQTSLVELFRKFDPELNLHERTIALYVCARLADSNRDSVDLTIQNVADATGLCWRTVQKYRLALLKKGVLRLLSRGRERSRYALSGERAYPESEKIVVSVEQPTATATTDIAELITSITGASATPEELIEAEHLAGGKLNLLYCLRFIHGTHRPPRSVRSLLSLISHLTRATGQPYGPATR
jgi:hypothetical protein